VPWCLSGDKIHFAGTANRCVLGDGVGGRRRVRPGFYAFWLGIPSILDKTGVPHEIVQPAAHLTWENQMCRTNRE